MFISNLIPLEIKKLIPRQLSSSWCVVDSVVQQGPFLEPLLFIIYLNDLTDNLAHAFKRYADNGKLLVSLETDRDNDDMQNDIDNTVEMYKNGSMELSPEKC